MEIKAKVKYIRMSPKKVRLVVDIIRGMRVLEAQEQLKFITKTAARPILKLLDSCIANAINNFQLKKDNLYVKKITVDEGSTLKRWKPRAFGRAAPIRKRSSHINIILDEIVPTKEKEVKKIISEGPSEIKDVKEKPTSPVVRTDRARGKEVEKDSLEKERQKEQKVEPFDKYRVAKRKEPEAFKKDVKKNKGFFKKIFRRKSV